RRARRSRWGEIPPFPDAGRSVVRLDLVAEGGTWLVDSGTIPYAVPIAVTPCAVLTRGGHSNCGNRWSVALATGRPDRLGRPDLLGEHPHVERTRGRVRIDVLALRLVALDEVSGRARQVLRARQPDHHGLGHDGTPELTRTGRAHGAASVSTIDAR